MSPIDFDGYKSPLIAKMILGDHAAYHPVNGTPTVDAVLVVRCDDCRHRGEGDVCPMIQLLWCEEEGYFYSDFTMDDYYCSFGERKDNYETMRLIDADALKEEVSSLRMVITGLRCGKGVLSEYAREYLKSILRIIDESPTIDAEPVKHGRWEEYPDKAHLRCTACKLEFPRNKLPKTRNRCPNCGAKMDAKED